MKPKRRFAAHLLIAIVLSNAVPVAAQTPNAPPPPTNKVENNDEVQPKYIWGIVINIALKYAM